VNQLDGQHLGPTHCSLAHLALPAFFVLAYQSPLSRYTRHDESHCVTKPSTSQHVLPQADLVAILATCVPPGSAVDQQLVVGYFLPYLQMQGTTGNLHKARAREAVAGALSRGLHVRLEDGSTRRADINSAALLAKALEECGKPFLCCRVVLLTACFVFAEHVLWP
jgi:hypothetical protein